MLEVTQYVAASYPVVSAELNYFVHKFVNLWQAGRNASLKLDSHAGQALSPFKWILDNQFLLLNKERDDNIAYHKCYILKYICIYVKKFESFLHTDFGIFSSQVILSLHLLVLDNSYRRNVYNI